MNDLVDREPGGTPTVSAAAPPRLGTDNFISLVLLGILVLLTLGFLYLARDFLLPVAIALLLAVVLNPVVRWLSRRGIPAPVSATALVATLLIGFVALGMMLIGPVSAIVADAPRISLEIQQKFSVLQRPLEAIGRATASIEQVVAPAEEAERVVVDGGSGAVLGYIAADAGQRLAATGLCLVLLLFILASGGLFLEKLIKVLPTLSDKKRALRIARDIEHQVSRLLFTLTFINIGLGVCVGIAFWLLGMPSPILWGIFAALANFLPFIGATVVAIAAFGIAVVSFDTLAQASLPVLALLALNVTEGQIVTPMVLGQRHALNAVVILASIAFWGWIWGIIGALIAVPMLVAVKVFADNVEAFRPFGEFLGAREAALQAGNGAVTSEIADYAGDAGPSPSAQSAVNSSSIRP